MYDPDQRKKNSEKTISKNSKPPDANRKGYMLRLKDLAGIGARWLSPKGKWYKIGSAGISNEDGSGTIPYGDMPAEDVRKILQGTELGKNNAEADIDKANTPVTKEWAIEFIRDLKAQGKDPWVIGWARIMYHRTFHENHPDYPPKPQPKRKAPGRPLEGSGRPSKPPKGLPVPLDAVLDEMHRDGQAELERQIRDDQEPEGVDLPPLPDDEAEAIPF